MKAARFRKTSTVLTIFNISCPILRTMARKTPLTSSLLLFLLIMAVSSCDPDRVFEEHIALKKGVWNAKNELQFNVTISDIISRYDVYLNVRNGTEYPYCNLYLFMTTVFPDDRTARDTIELTLADFDGRWLGSGMGSVKFSRFLFRENVQFKQKGNYAFSFGQAMRVNELKGIYDIGFRIEKQ